MEMKISSSVLKTKGATMSDVKFAMEASYNGFGGSGGYDNHRDGQLDSSQLLDQSTVKFWGGAKELHNIETIKKEDMRRKWKLSCTAAPVMLDTELSLEPMSTIISKVDANRKESSYKALVDLLGGEFKVLKKREEDQKKAKIEQEQIEGKITSGFSNMTR